MRTWALQRSLVAEHTFTDHTNEVTCLAVWAQKGLSAGSSAWAATGSRDCTVRVWSLAMQRAEGVLRGHEQEVVSMVAAGSEMLVSASSDGEIRCWSLTELVCIRTLVVAQRTTAQKICLTLSGTRLVCGVPGVEEEAGATGNNISGGLELHVLKLSSLTTEHVLRIKSAPGPISAMVTGEGELWACTGDLIIAWGWTKRSHPFEDSWKGRFWSLIAWLRNPP